MKKQISLKWKIGKYLLIFAVSLLAVLWVFQVKLLEPMYEAAKIDTVKKTSNEIVSAISSDDLAEKIYSESQQNDVCVRIISSSVDVTNGNLGCALYRMDSETILEQVSLAQANNGAYLYKQTGSDQGPAKMGDFKDIIYTRVVDIDSGRAIVMVYTGISPINATTRTLSSQLIFISIMVILATIGLTLLLTRKIAKPLTAINEEAKHLPSGEFNPDVRNSQYREAAELNATLTQAAADIKKADKAKRDLIANVSHDLRTPLTMISGYGEMMRDLPNEKTDENIQVIIDESKRLTTLVNDLLDLSKMQENRIELKRTDFNLSALIENESRKYEVYKVKEGFEIQTITVPEVMVYADESRMEQVIHNFMTNAINYSGHSKKIIVRETLKGRIVRVEVQDFGEGIAEKDLPNIWDRYYKVDKKHVRVSAGSGIGLAIVRQILDLHQFQYGVSSEVGKGSTFWFEMPTVVPAPKETCSESAKAA